jgi:hypothetical protein
MDVHIYETFVHFNQRLSLVVACLDVIEKLELAALDYVSKVRTNLSELRSYANNHFDSKFAQNEQEEEDNFYRDRRNRETAEGGPNETYGELKSREEPRGKQRLPPRAVIPLSTQADDDRILAMQKTASFSLPTQPEQPRITGDSELENQTGGTPT